MRKSAALLLVSLLLLCGLGSAQPGERIFMWKATAPQSTVYLLGSVHLATPKLYPLPPPMEQAFKASGTLVVEADEDKNPGTVQQYILTHGLYPPGDSIEAHVSPATKALLGPYAQGPAASMKPWLLAMTITQMELQKHGLDPAYGIDRHFMKAARASGKRIEELEGAEFQLKLLSGFSDKLQDAFLRSALKESAQVSQEVERLLAAWSSGDAAAMNKLLLEADKNDAELAQINIEMFDKRNVTMTSRIETYLKQPGTTFVIVGAGHLVGDKGIVTLLQRKGIKVEQLTTTAAIR